MRVVTKTDQKVKVKNETKENLIDEYGRLNELIKELTAKKEALREQLLTMYGEGEHEGENYIVSISSYEQLVLDPFKVAKVIGAKETLQIATVSVEKARALMGQMVEQCVKDKKIVTKVTVKEK